MQKIKCALIKLTRWPYLGLLILLLITFLMHLFTITHPSGMIFDEQYYVPDARQILAGGGTALPEQPPLGKLIIAGGIEVFGDNPWGWRMPAVILGIIALIMFYDICRKLGTSHKTAFLATMLLSVENLTFIHSGIAMLDIYVVVFTIAAFWFYLKGWLELAAVGVALATLCKLSGVLAIIPIVLHWIAIGYREVMPTYQLDNSANRFGVFNSRYGKPLRLIVAVALAPIAFFLLYGLSHRFIWGNWVPLIVWGHYNQGTLGEIVKLLNLTVDMKFSSFTTPLPSRPWEWLLSPTGSFNFYDWIFHPAKYLSFINWGVFSRSANGTMLFIPEKYSSTILPYYFTPTYTGVISPTIWLSSLAVIPYALWQAFRKNEAAMFTIFWIMGTWVIWILLSLTTNRVSYIYYYLPTIGAMCLGSSLIITTLLSKAEALKKGSDERTFGNNCRNLSSTAPTRFLCSISPAPVDFNSRLFAIISSFLVRVGFFPPFCYTVFSSYYLGCLNRAFYAARRARKLDSSKPNGQRSGGIRWYLGNGHANRASCLLGGVLNTWQAFK